MKTNDLDQELLEMEKFWSDCSKIWSKIQYESRKEMMDTRVEVIELTRKLFKLCEIDTLEKLREIVKLSGE